VVRVQQAVGRAAEDGVGGHDGVDFAGAHDVEEEPDVEDGAGGDDLGDSFEAGHVGGGRGGHGGGEALWRMGWDGMGWESDYLTQ